MDTIPLMRHLVQVLHYLIRGHLLKAIHRLRRLTGVARLQLILPS